MGLTWEGKIGPAFIIGLVQLFLVAGGGVVFLQRMQDSVDAQKAQIIEVRTAVDELRRNTVATGERITRVEERTDAVKDSISRIERKIDAPKN